jgi:hypothetical protein
MPACEIRFDRIALEKKNPPTSPSGGGLGKP